jgi:Serine dehydrogenase proteinase
MGLPERLELCRKIEDCRKRPLLVYVTSKRDGVEASMATDALPYLIDQLDALPKGATELDFLIVSYGGDPMVAWRIISLIRERVTKLAVLIPQSAYSAATLVALGGDEIIMHPNGHLGPVDMQIINFFDGKRKTFSTEDVSAFVEFVRDALGITDQEHLRNLFEITCREVGSLGVGFTARNQKLAVALALRLLNLPSEEESAGNKAIIDTLSRQFHSHSYPVSRKEAIKLQLPVVKDRDPNLESLMWQLWLDLENELQERTPFHPIAELLNDKAAGPILMAPVPQWSLPGNASGPTYFQAEIDAIKKELQDVKPVDFQIVDAILESERLCFRGVTKGKIIASRLPELNIQFNQLVTYRGWEKTHSK